MQLVEKVMTTHKQADRNRKFFNIISVTVRNGNFYIVLMLEKMRLKHCILINQHNESITTVFIPINMKILKSAFQVTVSHLFEDWRNKNILVFGLEPY